MKVIFGLLTLTCISMSLNAIDIGSSEEEVLPIFISSTYSETGECFTEALSSSVVVIGKDNKQTHFEISTIGKTGVKNISIKVLTSPGSDIIKLQIPATEIGGITWSLYNIDGSLLLQSFLWRGESEIPFNNISNGIYFLKVIRGPRILKNYKIVKK